MDLKPARKPAKPITSPEVVKDGVFLASFVLLIAIVALLSVPTLMVCPTGDGPAQSLLIQLSIAAKAYELDFAVYPSGDGTGSRGLAEALRRKSIKEMKYFEFDSGFPEISRAGDIRHPLDNEKIIYYRCPGLRNPKTFDLWCEDRKGRIDGVNNWNP